MKPTKTVWKFALPLEDVAGVDMPQGAHVLHVAAQHEVPTLWALVDPNAPLERRYFRFAGTGHPIKPEHAGRFVGTFFMAGGSLVWHLFELCRGLDSEQD